jgi:hypothetical protein
MVSANKGKTAEFICLKFFGKRRFMAGPETVDEVENRSLIT